MEECRKLLKVSFSVYLSLSLARALSLSVSVSLFLSCKTLAKVSFYLARTFERGERKREKERRANVSCVFAPVCVPPHPCVLGIVPDGGNTRWVAVGLFVSRYKYALRMPYGASMGVFRVVSICEHTQ